MGPEPPPAPPTRAKHRLCLRHRRTVTVCTLWELPVREALAYLQGHPAAAARILGTARERAENLQASLAAGSPRAIDIMLPPGGHEGSLKGGYALRERDGGAVPAVDSGAAAAACSTGSGSSSELEAAPPPAALARLPRRSFSLTVDARGVGSVALPDRSGAAASAAAGSEGAATPGQGEEPTTFLPLLLLLLLLLAPGEPPQ